MDRHDIEDVIRKPAAITADQFHTLPPVLRTVLEAAGVQGFSPLPLDSDNAMAIPRARKIAAPIADSGKPLLMAAHEAGHVATLNNIPGLAFAPQPFQEFIATQWAIDAIRKAGGVVTAEMQADARRALRSYTGPFPDGFYEFIGGKSDL